MRIACPYCGERGNEEFVYLGDASRLRPDPGSAPPPCPPPQVGESREGAFADYVYLRDNPRGLHRELWYHGVGCHSWLIVTRDTMSHEITRVEFARDTGYPQSSAAVFTDSRPITEQRRTLHPLPPRRGGEGGASPKRSEGDAPGGG